MDTEYPPEPWDLNGHGYVSVWPVPVSSLPELPRGVRPVTFFGKALVGTAFVDYLPGGLLPYHELLAAVLVRRGWRFGITITHIWVDNAASQAGARAMWGIPKELADFQMMHEPSFAGAAKALARARMWSRFPALRLPVPFRMAVLQTLNAALTRTPVRVVGRLGPARADWRIAPDGPLAWLSPHRPLTSVTITDFRMHFGS